MNGLEFGRRFRIQLSEGKKNKVWRKLAAEPFRILVEYFELRSANISDKINPLALELDIYNLIHHLCKT